MIGSLGNIVFYVNDFNVFTLKKELSRSRKVKITEHNPVYGIKTIRQQGREPVELKLSIELISTISKYPGIQMQQIKKFMEEGKFSHLILGYHVMGEFPFLITGIDETLSHYNSITGDFDYINLDITLLEYVDDPLFYQRKMKYFKTAKEFLSSDKKINVILEQKKVIK